MDPHTADIVRLAWTRGLGLPDDAFASQSGMPFIVDEGLPGVEFLELFGRTVLRGPERWAAPLAGSPASAFHDGSALSLLNGSGVDGSAALRTTARERLAYRDHYAHRSPGAVHAADPGAVPAPGGTPLPGTAGMPTISHAAGDAAQVLAQCPSDDAAGIAEYVREAGPADPPAPDTDEPPTLFTLVVDGRRTALAGYRTMHSLLADLRAVTAPEMRRRGHASTAAGLAAEDALDAGLVCQARWPDESAAGAALAVRLGFTHAGSRVVISPGPEYHR